MRWKILVPALAAGVSLAAAPASAASFLYAKPGVALAPTLADQEACAKEAQKISVPYNAAPAGAAAASGGVAGAAAASLVTGFLQGMQEGRMRSKALDACMRSKGYAKLALTDEEAAALRKVGSERAARQAWIETFLAGDLSARIAEASRPEVAPLPMLAAEPFAVGGARIDPATVVAATGPVGRGGVLLAGRLSHRRTATVAEDFESKVGLFRLRIAKGAVFYGVEYRPRPGEREDPSSAWCGPASITGMMMNRVDSACVASSFEGYQLLQQDGYGQTARAERAWMTGPPTSPRPDLVVKPGSLKLEPSATDLLGGMDFALKLTRFGKAEVGLEATALRDGKPVVFWRGEAPLDAGGDAVLPFWTHSLRLHRSGDSVTARLDADGDGRGWAELDTPVPAA